MSRGYKINLDYLCRNRTFSPSQVVSSELVFPRGAVPNSVLMWIKIELTSGDRRFITLPLVDFYKYVELPESSIGGWTDGEVGSDIFGLDPRYAIVDSVGGDAIRDELQHGAEGAEETVA